MALSSAFRPAFSVGRISAGVAGGIAGGLLFGILLLTTAIFEPGPGVGASAVELLGTNSVVVLWGAHMAMSIVLGVLFAILVPPDSLRTASLMGMLYATGLWLVTYMLVLRGLTDAPFAFDAAAAYALIGHLAYGLGLGLVYVAFHRMEVTEALSSDDERVRRWGRRERRGAR